MKKFFVLIMLALVFVLVIMTVTSCKKDNDDPMFNLPESSEGLAFRLNTDGNGYTVTGVGTCISTEIVIGKYEGKPVTAIAAFAFRDKTHITKISIGDAVVEIGDGAFDGCTVLQYNEYGGVKYLGNDKKPYIVLVEAVNKTCESYDTHPNTKFILPCAFEFCKMKSITLHKGLLSIGANAFNTCLNLEEVIIPEGVRSIGVRAFCRCEALKTVVIPGSVKSISQEAFKRTVRLNNITIGDGVTEICNGAFQEGGGNNIVIPDTVTYIGNSAFEKGHIGNLHIGSGVTDIGERAFYECRIYNTTLTIPGNVRSIGASAFQKSLSIEAVILGDGVEIIGEKAFSGCESLKTVDLGNTVKSIGDSAFEGCRLIKKIVIPDSTQIIGSKAFDNCFDLTDVTVGNGLIKVGVWAFLDKAVNTVYKGRKYLGNAENPYYVFVGYTSGASGASYEIHKDTKVIADGAMLEATFATIEIPDGVISIGTYAFAYNESLTEIVIPDSVEYIHGFAFEGCAALSSVTMGKNVKVIGDKAFAYCSAMKEILIPDGLESIGAWAFYSSGLKSIVIPESVSFIGDEAFVKCPGLIIYCRAQAEPVTWSIYWNSSENRVVWGYQ